MRETDTFKRTLDSIEAPDLWVDIKGRAPKANLVPNLESIRPRRSLKPALVIGILILALGFVNSWRVFPPFFVSTSTMSATYDVTDPRKVVGHSNHVWIGKVLERMDSFPMDADGKRRATQFNVRVLENIKGNLAGDVLVRQPGWLDTNLNTVHLFQGDPLLKEGEVVLFATTSLQDSGMTYELIGYPGYKDIRIRSEQERSQQTQRYMDAYRNQITYEDEQQGS